MAKKAIKKEETATVAAASRPRVSKKGPVQFKVMLDPGALAPERAHTNDVGYDMHALEVEYVYEKPTWWQRLLHIEPRIATVKCDTGVHLAPLDEGYWVMGLPNSRAAKMPFVLGNSCGVIDPGYRGSIRFIYNVLPYGRKLTNARVRDFFEPHFDGDDRHQKVVGQIVVLPRLSMDLEVVDGLPSSERGEGGFGSTAN